MNVPVFHVSAIWNVVASSQTVIQFFIFIFRFSLCFMSFHILCPSARLFNHTNCYNFSLLRTWNQFTLTVFTLNWIETRRARERAIELILFYFSCKCGNVNTRLMKLHADTVDNALHYEMEFYYSQSMWRFHTFSCAGTRHGRASIFYASLLCSWYAQVQTFR